MERPTRDQALSMPLRELDGCDLRVQCPPEAHCSKVTIIGVANLQRHARSLTQALPRLKCRSCGSRAGRVVLHGPSTTGVDPFLPPEPAWALELMG